LLLISPPRRRARSPHLLPDSAPAAGYGPPQPNGLAPPGGAPRPGPPGPPGAALPPPGAPRPPAAYGAPPPQAQAYGAPPQAPPQGYGAPPQGYAPPRAPQAYSAVPATPAPPPQQQQQPYAPPRPAGFGAPPPPPPQQQQQAPQPPQQQQQAPRQQPQYPGASAPRPPAYPGGPPPPGGLPPPPGGARPAAFAPGPPAPAPAFPGAPPPRPAYPGAPPPPGAAAPPPPGPGVPGAFVPRAGPPGAFGAPPPGTPGPGSYGAPPPPPPGPASGPAPGAYGAPPPPMRHVPGVGLGAPPPGHGFDAGVAAALDAFETLSLGPGGPGAPGAPSAPAADAATFPRPCGTRAQEAAMLGPAPAFSPLSCSPTFLRLTAAAAPNSAALKARWHLPWGAVLHPLAEAGGPVPVANAGGATIVRCKRCRTYMNPFVTWLDGGRRFGCNICGMSNETPVDYFCALDASGRRLDAATRPELASGSAEYVAPAEYMVRAPMPPTYVFVIDVSFAAVASGLVGAACAAIRAALDALPGEGRTQVAFLTYDATLHFYALRPGAAAPQMLVVAETDDPFVPLPDDLLVNLAECRPAVERLLDAIPASFARTQCAEAAAGPALQAAFLAMNHVGGKLLLFAAAPPSAGIGRVKARDNPALYGTDREAALRAPDDPFYKRFSAEASRFQICVDVFAAGAAFMDLPSLGALPRYTGGALYYYPGFAAERDAPKLAAEVARNLGRHTVWEAVMRVRCSKGLRISAFHGHFFVRSTDLLALPACDADKALAVEIAHEETVVAGGAAFMQAALLYTSSAGERRIRVHTLAMPVVSDLLEMYKASDAGATAALLAKVSVERAMAAKLEDVRLGIQQRLAASLREYRGILARGAPGGGPPPTALALPERLRAAPLLALGLARCAALRGSGRDVNADERAAVAAQVASAPAADVLRLIYPAVYRVDDASGDWGRPSADGEAALPPSAPAGLEYLDPSGAYLLDNGRVAVLWVGAAAPPPLLAALFGPGAASGDAGALRLEPPRAGSELSARACAAAAALRARRETRQEVYVVRQGTPTEAHVMPYFVEDRAGGGAAAAPGYLDYVSALQRMVANPAAKG
jgi:protein transport protein SEC24